MTVTDHLTELRRRLLVGIFSLVAAMAVGFPLAFPVIQQFKQLAPKFASFVQLSPGESLFVVCKVGVLLGFLLSAPVWLYQIARFVTPGLLGPERRLLVTLLVSALGCFLLGGGFAAQWVLPPTLNWLLLFGADLAPYQMSLSHYVDFCLAVVGLTAVMFELPVLLVLLGKLGWVRSQQLAEKWRSVVLATLVLAAVLTPSQDPVSMAMVGVVLLGLLGASWLILRAMGC
jgi:sec-independent protein translocase protein TatC